MPLLEITRLTKTYARPGGGTHRVVDVREFSLEAGAQLALRGESGSGKTTFLHLIAGILAADAARVVIDGAEMTALGEAGATGCARSKSATFSRPSTCCRATPCWRMSCSA
jgi:ABC-type lipoprotein export system ATPase subunit